MKKLILILSFALLGSLAYGQLDTLVEVGQGRHNRGGDSKREAYEKINNNFDAFVGHVTALPNYGEEGYTLDRERNDEGYYPGNVRWTDYHTQNANRQQYSNNKSGYTGVSYYKPYDKWVSKISNGKKRVTIGYFTTMEKAVEARNQYIVDHDLVEYLIQTI